MKFSKQDEFTMTLANTVETISTFDYDALVAQRAQVVEIRDQDVARRNNEIAQIDGLLAQCTAVGVASRTAAISLPIGVVEPLSE